MKAKFWRLDREKALLSLKIWVNSLSHDPNVICVVLFGSLARGDATAASDADLLVILRSSDKRFDERIPDFLPSGVGMSVDVFPYTKEEVRKALKEGWGVVGTAFREGLWLLDKEGLRNQLEN